MSIQGWSKAMAATHMTNTPVATARPTLSLTGLGYVNTPIRYLSGRELATRRGRHRPDPATCPDIRPAALLRIGSVLMDLEQASDASLVVAVARWHEPALAEVYR